MVLVVCGVAGSGKSTVGQALAASLGVAYAEADEFHPERNRRKMAAGEPLSDVDRQPWLQSIARWIDERETGVVTCSALRKAHRAMLRRPHLRFVFLKVDQALVKERLARRQGHFFPQSLAASQFEALEEPDAREHDVIIVEADQPVPALVSQIFKTLDVPL